MVIFHSYVKLPEGTGTKTFISRDNGGSSIGESMDYFYLPSEVLLTSNGDLSTNFMPNSSTNHVMTSMWTRELTIDSLIDGFITDLLISIIWL